LIMSIEKWRIPNGHATHVLMSGGILFVPTEETQEFYQSCVDAIKSGTKLYVVEQKTERFKFFIDLDYKAQEKLKDEDLIQFCSIIRDAISDGVGTASRCLIARARPRPVGEGLIKSGVHIHWPDLVVSRTQALHFRTKIILKLSEYFSFDWDRVIDASVYGGSGLRMLWSHKKPTGDPYIPWRDLDGDAFSKEPNVETLALFAVRTDEDPRQEEVLENNGPLEEFVRKYLEGQGRAHIKKVQRHDHDGWFAQSDSKYCERIHKEHKSNHSWFSVRSGRVSQRCFDEECREFRGQEHILPPSIVEQLNDVAIVGSPSCSFLMDFLPDGPCRTFQEVQRAGSRVLGSGPGELAKIFDKHPRVRTVGFDRPSG
jgi:hypothetical protein